MAVPRRSGHGGEAEEGILDRIRCSERPERYEYRLTPKGRDLVVTLAGLRQWGDKY